MAADIGEGAERAARPAQGDDGAGRQIGREVIAGVGDLGGMADEAPAGREAALDLAGEEFRRGVAMGRQGERPAERLALFNVEGGIEHGAMVGAGRGCGQPAAIGRALFTDYLFPFEVTSVLLLVALVGVMALAKRRVA